MVNYKFSCDDKKISNENIIKVTNLLTNIKKEQDNSTNINSNYIEAVNQIIHFLKLAVKYYQLIHFKENNITIANNKEDDVMKEDSMEDTSPLQKRLAQTDKISSCVPNISGYSLSGNLDSTKNYDKDDDNQRSSSPILNYYENKLKTETDILNDISLKKQELIKRVENLKKERNGEPFLKTRKLSSITQQTTNKPTHIRHSTNSFSYAIDSNRNMNQDNHRSQMIGQSKFYPNESHGHNITEVNIEKSLKDIKEYKQKINKMLIDMDRKVTLPYNLIIIMLNHY